jgi:cell wall-associated NlpC family hydrolase
MKEALVVLICLPLVLLVVVNNSLQTYAPVAQPTVTARVAVPTPRVAATVVPQVHAVVSSSIIDAARQWLGTPYLWGGCTTRGIDCSCFVKNVLAQFGINAPRTTTAQVQWGTPVSEPQLGDLVFFNNTCQNCGPNPTHVGLAIGGGLMIHAGDPVQVASIASFGSKYAGARRPPQ